MWKNAEVAVHEGRYIPKDKGLVREYNRKDDVRSTCETLSIMKLCGYGVGSKGSGVCCAHHCRTQDGTDAGEVWG